MVPSVTGTAPHAKGIPLESAQPAGDQLSLLFSLNLAAGARVRVWFGHPVPQALSPSQCPQPIPCEGSQGEELLFLRSGLSCQ